MNIKYKSILNVLRLQEIENFATIFFGAKDPQKMDHGKLNSYIDPAVDRFKHNLINEEEQETYRAKLKGYLSMYSFLSQVVNFTDAGLEKLFVYSKFLIAKLKQLLKLNKHFFLHLNLMLN